MNKEGLQKAEKRNEQNHRQAQEGIFWEHMWRAYRISENKGFGVMYVKTEELGRKEIESVQNIEIEESQETIRVDQKEML